MKTLLFATVVTACFWASFIGVAGVGPVPKDLQVGDTKGIPPDILKQMDVAIVLGKRPTIDTIKLEDIFSLRDNPKRNADFVRFDFDAAELTGAQRVVLDRWLQTSGSRVLLLDADIWNYRELTGVGDAAKIQRWRINLDKTDGKRHEEIQLEREEPVTTDVERSPPRGTEFNKFKGGLEFVLFCIEDGAPGLEASIVFGAWEHAQIITWISRVTRFPPAPDTTNLRIDKIRELPGNANRKDIPRRIYSGRLVVGNSQVYFLNTPEGPDQPRFMMNFWHWALGLKVPGAVDPLGGTMASTSRASLDFVRLKNGDEVSGRVLNETLTLKASYATLTFKRSEIDSIVIEGGTNNNDEVRLVIGDRITGVLQEDTIRLRLAGGEETEIAKDKIKEFQIRHTSEEAETGDDSSN